MCGISGLFLREGESPDRSLLERMARRMRHRGPDGEGVFVEGRVGLAHRRLSVIDLSALAAQPLFSEDRRVGVVFNGEIYNFGELRAELEREGHRFASRSDTEVIVHAYEQWGEKAFRRLNGMFAFALWDGRGPEPVLYLARDRFGVKPLFYAENSGRVAFASELKPLMELDWIDRRIHPQTLFHYLKFSHVPTPLSIFQGVKQLRPGHFLRVEAAGCAEGVFWDPLECSPSKEVPLIPQTEEALLARAEATLRDAVRRQVVSDVPVGCFLSGGIDSSLLTMAYASLDAPRIRTFSIGYREREFDETPFAAEVARAFHTEHHEWVARPRDFFDLIPDVPEYFDQPFADPTLLPTLLLARFARQHVTVALSGDGGDELFFGYAQQRALLYLRLLGSLPGRARRGALEAGRKALRALGRSELGAKAEKLAEILQFRDEAELFQYFIGTIGPLRLDRVAGLVDAEVRTSVPWLEPVLDAVAGLPPEERIAQAFIRTFLVDTVLAKTDRAGMAFGLEARVPFLDDEMVALARETPFGLKYRHGTTKFLLRRLLERKLREKGLGTALSRRPKQGFSVPMRDWLRGDLRYLLDEYLSSHRIARDGVFRPREVSALVREHLDGRANHSHLLWSLVSFQMWKERYVP